VLTSISRVTPSHSNESLEEKERREKEEKIREAKKDLLKQRYREAQLKQVSCNYFKEFFF
jgi:hypothetical protein